MALSFNTFITAKFINPELILMKAYKLRKEAVKQDKQALFFYKVTWTYIPYICTTILLNTVLSLPYSNKLA